MSRSPSPAERGGSLYSGPLPGSGRYIRGFHEVTTEICFLRCIVTEHFIFFMMSVILFAFFLLDSQRASKPVPSGFICQAFFFLNHCKSYKHLNLAPTKSKHLHHQLTFRHNLTTDKCDFNPKYCCSRLHCRLGCVVVICIHAFH